jgi:hypothetical protein
MKNRLLFAMANALLIASCNFTTQELPKSEIILDAGSQIQTVKELVGKTVAYQYGESIYHVTFDTDSTMHWEAMAGDEKGALEHETYVAEFFEPGKFFISWGEANGINVSQVLDFKKGNVYNHLVRDRKTSRGDGQIKIIE